MATNEKVCILLLPKVVFLLRIIITRLTVECLRHCSNETSTTSLDPNAPKQGQVEGDAADAATSKGTDPPVDLNF
jgi:hypothetical protein